MEYFIEAINIRGWIYSQVKNLNELFTIKLE